MTTHDPAWAGSNDSDPGMTLPEVAGWIADRLGSAGYIIPEVMLGASARPDPYRNFNFRVTWEGKPVAGVTRISALRRTADIVEHRDGADPQRVQRLPGRSTCRPFAIERPLGGDTAFEDWADQIRQPKAAAGFLKDVRIEILDHAGRLFLAYDVLGCWPAAYRVLPDLTESLTLIPDDWKRDRSVKPAT